VQTKLVSIREAAKALGVGRSTVYQMLSDQRLDSVKLYRRRLITVESIDRVIGN
jgi:excisionase family DNA binding protein